MANKVITSGGQKFTTVVDLQNYTSKIVKQAETNTLERLKKVLLRYMKSYIYNTPEGWYKRTGDLYSSDAWLIVHEYLTRRASGTEIRASLKPNDATFTHNSESWQHATQHKPKDIAWTELTSYDLINLINNGISDENSLFGEIEARPFWEDFVEYARKNYSKIFRKECKKLGIELTGRSQGTYISDNYNSIITKYK